MTHTHFFWGGGGVIFYSDTFRVDSTRTHSHWLGGGGGEVFFYSDTFRVDSTRTHSHGGGGGFIVTPLELIVQGLIPIDGGGGGYL